jgi:enoyl-CoA hydratase/carnithine racemase
MTHATVERRDRVAVVTLNRPEALNAISGAVADDLRDAFAAVAADPEAWVMVLAAAGDKAFCVGADLKERAAFTDEEWPANRHHISPRSASGSFRGAAGPRCSRARPGPRTPRT